MLQKEHDYDEQGAGGEEWREGRREKRRSKILYPQGSRSATGRDGNYVYCTRTKRRSDAVYVQTRRDG